MKRKIWLIGGTLLAIMSLYLTNPDNSMANILLGLVYLSVVFAPLVVAHLNRKMMFHYPEADMQTLFRIAGQSPTGAGIALLSLSVAFSSVFIGICVLILHWM